MLSLLWLLCATVAAVIIARLVSCSNFWRSEAPIVSEVLNVWLILTLVVAGSLMGRSEPLMKIWAEQNRALLTVQ